MKTTGVSCETKFGLLGFLGHPNGQWCMHYGFVKNVSKLWAWHSKKRANCFYSKMKKNYKGGEKNSSCSCSHPMDSFAISDGWNFFKRQNLLFAFAYYFERSKKKSSKPISFDH